MSESAPITTPATSIRRSPTPALLTLDAGGRVLHASAAAGALWQVDPARLAGTAFPNLFAFEIVSQDPTWTEAQWEVLVASALDKSIPLQAQPFESGPLPVRLHLETAGGDRVAYFATITPEAAVSPAVRPAASTDLGGLDVLATQSNLGFFHLDLKSGRIRYSPAWKRQLGYPESELPDTYETWLRLLHPEDSAAAPDRVGKKALSGSRNFSVEFRMKHRRGHWVWLQCCGVQIFNTAGELEQVIGLHLDVTERKELEESALLAEERFLRLATDGALAAFDFDFIQQQFWCSPAWQQLVGADEPGEPGGLDSFTQALPPDVAEQGVEAFFLGPATGRTDFVMPAALRRRDGTALPVIVGVSRQLTRRRDLARVVGFAVPLPAGASALVEAGTPPAELVYAAFSALGEAVLLTDAKADILYLNPQAERLTGHALAGARSLKLGDVFRLVTRSDGRPADDAVDLVLAAEEKPRLHADHALIPASGGPPLPIVWTARQTWNDRGGSPGLVIIFRDPQQMTLTPEELVRANRFDTLGQLAGGISHDFNNLLTTILGGISHAKDNRDYTYLEDAERACLAAKTLTRQLLAFAKGSETSAFHVLGPGDLLRDAIRLAAAGSTARITLETDDNAGPVEINRSQMLQVFQNLIINALQAMPDQSKGELWLRCHNVELAEDELPPLAAGDYVQMDVQDNGSGIPPELLEKIFEPFFTTKKQGTGLGLATVLSIVRKHGGQIGVDSTVGTGTTFTVFLPRAERPVETETRRAPALRYGTGRVLFMDDDPKICDLTGNMLASLDYKYDIAKSGEEAIALYRRYLNVNRPYDVVIMDLTVVGGMGGEECFQQLHALDPEVRAIVSSGYDSEEMAQRYLEMGFCGYLTKPYRVGELGKILKSVLGP
ncbi:MAG TPA: ATP-binding protein [Opitutaceae bacterium]